MKTETLVKPHVLIVDDDAGCRSLIRELLGNDFACDEAVDGKEAIEKLQIKRSDLVISDIWMPHLNGFDLCLYVKNTFKSYFIPVILITGRVDVGTYQKAIASEVDEFLEKPFQQAILKMKIRSLLKLQQLYFEKQKALEKMIETEELQQELIQMVAHDMKNPLAAIRGYTELLALDEIIRAHPRVYEFVSKMFHSCDDLMRMILNFLDLSKMEQKSFKIKSSSFNLKQMLENILSKYQSIFQRTNHPLRLDFKLRTGEINADAELIERVLLNLINNALKYSDKNTDISICLVEFNDKYRFSIQDQGAGIPEKYHQLIFEKYNQVRSVSANMRSDTGLGLAFCKRAIEAHDGRIWVESSIGKGSCFIFEIPKWQHQKTFSYLRTG